MVARKKTEEQAEITAENNGCMSREEPEEVIPTPYERHVSMMLERSNVAEKAMKALDRAMINKALLLLEASGEGAGDLKIKQIETAIEIYKAVQIL
ncbi:hypothetical protein [Phascolarctobacterium sp.]